MRDSEFLVWIGIVLLVVAVIAALIAGNIINQLFAPAPSVAGPLGAGVGLFVFLFLLGKGGVIVLSLFR